MLFNEMMTSIALHCSAFVSVKYSKINDSITPLSYVPNIMPDIDSKGSKLTYKYRGKYSLI